MAFRATVVDPSQLLIGGIIGSIAIPIGKDDSLGVLLVEAILVTASDVLVMLNGILPVRTPNLKWTDCPSIITNSLGVSSRLNLLNRLQEAFVS